MTDAVTGKLIPKFVDDPGGRVPRPLTADGITPWRVRMAVLNSWRREPTCPRRLRVEAAGYRSQDGPEFHIGDDAARKQDFRLRPSPPLAGTSSTPPADPQPMRKFCWRPRPSANLSQTRDLGNITAVHRRTRGDSVPRPRRTLCRCCRSECRVRPQPISRPANTTSAGCGCGAWASVKRPVPRWWPTHLWGHCHDRNRFASTIRTSHRLLSSCDNHRRGRPVRVLPRAARARECPCDLGPWRTPVTDRVRPFRSI